MTISIIDESQRKAARVAGFTFLFAMAIVVLVRRAHGYLRNGIGPLASVQRLESIRAGRAR
jgi:hypothetical protein